VTGSGDQSPNRKCILDAKNVSSGHKCSLVSIAPFDAVFGVLTILDSWGLSSSAPRLYLYIVHILYSSETLMLWPVL